MKEVIDRVPTRPNRIKLTSESDGSINYYAWERADEPITDGTPINKELFDSIGADITSLQQTVSTNTSDIQAIKARDVEQDSAIANLNNATRINLLKPILETTTKNNVICTNNGDGTYTLNGTATAQTQFFIMNNTANTFNGKKILGCPSGGSKTTYNILLGYYNEDGKWQDGIYDTENGIIVENINPIINLSILIRSGVTCNNLLFKPMITPNLNATYDDFVSYEDSLATNKVVATKTVTLGTTWEQDTTNGYYTQTVALSGITSKDNPTVDVNLSGTLAQMLSQQDEWGKILKIETSTDTLKFYASEPTTVSLSVMVKGV